MNDLQKAKANIWNERLKKCMDTHSLTQMSLAESLSRKYNTKKEITQKTISRWLNVGSKIKGGIIGFPKFDAIVLIADFFNVDIGYLMGETDEDSFLIDDVCSFMGLKSESIKSIRGVTNPDNHTSLLWKEKKETLDKFLSADKFPLLLESLDDLLAINSNLKCEFENLDSVIDYSDHIKMNEKIYRYTISESLILLIDELYSSPTFTDVIIKGEDDIS